MACSWVMRYPFSQAAAKIASPNASRATLTLRSCSWSSAEIHDMPQSLRPRREDTQLARFAAQPVLRMRDYRATQERPRFPPTHAGSKGFAHRVSALLYGHPVAEPRSRDYRGRGPCLKSSSLSEVVPTGETVTTSTARTHKGTSTSRIAQPLT